MDNSGWFEDEKLEKQDDSVVYEPRNMANIPAFVYLGKSFSSDLDRVENSSDLDRVENLTPDQMRASKTNCQTTLLFGSIVGGKCVRVDASTDDDPYLYIDAKWFDLKPYSYYEQWVESYNPSAGEKLFEYIADLQSQIDDSIPTNNVLSSVTYDYEKSFFHNFDGEYVEKDDFISNPVYNIKSLTSDGSVIVEANGGDFWWGTNAQPNGNTNNTSPDGALKLKAIEYSIENDSCFIGFALIKDRVTDPARNEKVYTTSDLEAGEGICIAEYNFSLNQFQGKLEEDLSDIIPEGVIQIGCLNKCVP